jgi:hypothetical protein
MLMKSSALTENHIISWLSHQHTKAPSLKTLDTPLYFFVYEPLPKNLPPNAWKSQ